MLDDFQYSSGPKCHPANPRDVGWFKLRPQGNTSLILLSLVDHHILNRTVSALLWQNSQKEHIWVSATNSPPVHRHSLNYSPNTKSQPISPTDTCSRTHTHTHSQIHTDTQPFKDISLLKLNLSFFPLPSTTHCRSQQNKHQHFCALIVTPAKREGGESHMLLSNTHTHTDSQHHSPSMDKGMSPCTVESARRALWQRVFTGCVSNERTTKMIYCSVIAKASSRLVPSILVLDHHRHFLAWQRIWQCDEAVSQHGAHVIDSYWLSPLPQSTDSVKPHIRPSCENTDTTCNYSTLQHYNAVG